MGRVRADRIWRKELPALSFVLGAVMVVLSVTADASHSFHKYSVAYETSAGTAYTAVQVVRSDGSFSISSGSSCTTHFTTPVVYQTQWVVMTSDAQNWVEIGTGHQCDGFRYWFWGTGQGGVWYPLGTADNVGTNTHTFTIRREAGKDWVYRVDGVHKMTLVWQITGLFDSVGLESYDGHAVAGSHTYRQLSRQINEGAWELWAGFDNKRVDGPEMCGGWNSASEWRAAENSSC